MKGLQRNLPFLVDDVLKGASLDAGLVVHGTGNPVAALLNSYVVRRAEEALREEAVSAPASAAGVLRGLVQVLDARASLHPRRGVLAAGLTAAARCAAACCSASTSLAPRRPDPLRMRCAVFAMPSSLRRGARHAQKMVPTMRSEKTSSMNCDSWWRSCATARSLTP